jgi:hypothetical protein
MTDTTLLLLVVGFELKTNSLTAESHSPLPHPIIGLITGFVIALNNYRPKDKDQSCVYQ